MRNDEQKRRNDNHLEKVHPSQALRAIQEIKQEFLNSINSHIKTGSVSEAKLQEIARSAFLKDLNPEQQRGLCELTLDAAEKNPNTTIQKSIKQIYDKVSPSALIEALYSHCSLDEKGLDANKLKQGYCQTAWKKINTKQDSLSASDKHYKEKLEKVISEQPGQRGRAAGTVKEMRQRANAMSGRPARSNKGETPGDEDGPGTRL